MWWCVSVELFVIEVQNIVAINGLAVFLFDLIGMVMRHCNLFLSEFQLSRNDISLVSLLVIGFYQLCRGFISQEIFFLTNIHYTSNYNIYYIYQNYNIYQTKYENNSLQVQLANVFLFFFFFCNGPFLYNKWELAAMIEIYINCVIISFRQLHIKIVDNIFSYF